MNPLKKAYCRMFQSVLKAAIPFLPVSQTRDYPLCPRHSANSGKEKV